jgi:hypothetical protein
MTTTENGLTWTFAFRVGDTLYYHLVVPQTFLHLAIRNFATEEAARLEGKRIGATVYEKFPGEYQRYTFVGFPKRAERGQVS